MFSFNKLMSKFRMCRDDIIAYCCLCCLLFGPIVLVTVVTFGVLTADHYVHFSIANATVVRFAVSAAPNATAATAAAFDYDIRADLQIYNRYNDIFYDILVYNYLFNGTQFAGWGVPAFDQKSMNATVLPMNVTGSATKTGVSPTLIDEFERSSRTGVFDLELRLDGIYHSDMDDISLIAVRCPLSVRLASAVSAINCKLIKCQGAEANGCRPVTPYLNLIVPRRARRAGKSI